jgi:hypothetical protein
MSIDWNGEVNCLHDENIRVVCVGQIAVTVKCYGVQYRVNKHTGEALSSKLNEDWDVFQVDTVEQKALDIVKRIRFESTPEELIAELRDAGCFN